MTSFWGKMSSKDHIVKRKKQDAAVKENQLLNTEMPDQ